MNGADKCFQKDQKQVAILGDILSCTKLSYGRDKLVVQCHENIKDRTPRARKNQGYFWAV